LEDGGEHDHLYGRRAVLRAADDIIRQLKSLAAIVLKCPPENLEVEDEKVYVKSDPDLYMTFRDLAHGYQYPNGNSVEGQILGGEALSWRTSISSTSIPAKANQGLIGR
jgi:CO/xanthine dehydrogenase Mo-binding subunit